MPKSFADKVIKELTSELSNEFRDFKGVYFYGSRARQTESEESDYDIVAVFDFVDRSKRMKIWGIVGEIEYKFDVFLDLHPMTREELEFNPYYYEQVVKNGIFYEAA